jgi:hypothetical protein
MLGSRELDIRIREAGSDITLEWFQVKIGPNLFLGPDACKIYGR